ncbi:MAG: hypothetical protein HY459_00510 [Parcubacteria group bacterium]|nr:hypothetical protein [Parcubacteria group bacterium]
MPVLDAGRLNTVYTGFLLVKNAPSRPQATIVNPNPAPLPIAVTRVDPAEGGAWAITFNSVNSAGQQVPPANVYSGSFILQVTAAGVNCVQDQIAFSVGDPNQSQICYDVPTIRDPDGTGTPFICPVHAVSPNQPDTLNSATTGRSYNSDCFEILNNVGPGATHFDVVSSIEADLAVVPCTTENVPNDRTFIQLSSGRIPSSIPIGTEIEVRVQIKNSDEEILAERLFSISVETILPQNSFTCRISGFVKGKPPALFGAPFDQNNPYNPKEDDIGIEKARVSARVQVGDYVATEDNLGTRAQETVETVGSSGYFELDLHFPALTPNQASTIDIEDLRNVEIIAWKPATDPVDPTQPATFGYRAQTIRKDFPADHLKVVGDRIECSENPITEPTDIDLSGIEFHLQIAGTELLAPIGRGPGGIVGVPDKNGICFYLATAGNFLLGIVGGLAMLMLVIAGYQYMTAGGNQSAVSAAKDRISSALTGLILAFLALLIIRYVNPAAAICGPGAPSNIGLSDGGNEGGGNGGGNDNNEFEAHLRAGPDANDLRQNSITVDPNTPFILAWNLTNAPDNPKCTLDGVGVAIEGQQTEPGLTAERTYTLHCVGTGDIEATATMRVQVREPQVVSQCTLSVASLTLDRTQLPLAGGNVNVNWALTAGSSVTINNTVLNVLIDGEDTAARNVDIPVPSLSGTTPISLQDGEVPADLTFTFRAPCSDGNSATSTSQTWHIDLETVQSQCSLEIRDLQTVPPAIPTIGERDVELAWNEIRPTGPVDFSRGASLRVSIANSGVNFGRTVFETGISNVSERGDRVRLDFIETELSNYNPLLVDAEFSAPCGSGGNRVSRTERVSITNDNAGGPGTQTFTISGRVTESGAGIGNVSIGYGSGQPIFTDANGSYEIANIPQGTYTLTITPPSERSCTPSSIPVTVGPNATGKDFTCINSQPVTYAITGRVTDRSGNLIERAIIYRMGAQGGESSSRLSVDASGNNYLISLSSGTYQLEVTPSSAGETCNTNPSGTSSEVTLPTSAQDGSATLNFTCVGASPQLSSRFVKPADPDNDGRATIQDESADDIDGAGRVGTASFLLEGSIQAPSGVSYRYAFFENGTEIPASNATARGTGEEQIAGPSTVSNKSVNASNEYHLCVTAGAIVTFSEGCPSIRVSIEPALPQTPTPYTLIGNMRFVDETPPAQVVVFDVVDYFGDPVAGGERLSTDRAGDFVAVGLPRLADGGEHCIRVHPSGQIIGNEPYCVTAAQVGNANEFHLTDPIILQRNTFVIVTIRTWMLNGEVILSRSHPNDTEDPLTGAEVTITFDSPIGEREVNISDNSPEDVDRAGGVITVNLYDPSEGHGDLPLFFGVSHPEAFTRTFALTLADNQRNAVRNVTFIPRNASQLPSFFKVSGRVCEAHGIDANGCTGNNPIAGAYPRLVVPKARVHDDTLSESATNAGSIGEYAILAFKETPTFVDFDRQARFELFTPEIDGVPVFLEVYPPPPQGYGSSFRSWNGINRSLPDEDLYLPRL